MGDQPAELEPAGIPKARAAACGRGGVERGGGGKRGHEIGGGGGKPVKKEGFLASGIRITASDPARNVCNSPPHNTHTISNRLCTLNIIVACIAPELEHGTRAPNHIC